MHGGTSYIYMRKPCRPPALVSQRYLTAGLSYFMRDFAKTFYRSQAWRDVREYCMHRDSFLCQDCLAEGRYTPAEEVHHIIPLTPENIHSPSVALNPDNLVSLLPFLYTIDEVEKWLRTVSDLEVEAIVRWRFKLCLSWRATSVRVYGYPNADRARKKLERSKKIQQFRNVRSLVCYGDDGFKTVRQVISFPLITPR